MKDEYFELQGVIKNEAIISDVEVKNNKTYFRIDGRLFHTFHRYVEHEDSPLFDHPFTNYEAKRHNTPEGIKEEEESKERINKSIDLWDKHKDSIYKIVFIKAVHILADRGEEEFIEYIDHHFDIMENDDNCKKLIELLEKK